MKNKINIAELLKDCPKGMELDSPVYNNLTYDYVNQEQGRIYCKMEMRDAFYENFKELIDSCKEFL